MQPNLMLMTKEVCLMGRAQGALPWLTMTIRLRCCTAFLHVLIDQLSLIFGFLVKLNFPGEESLFVDEALKVVGKAALN